MITSNISCESWGIWGKGTGWVGRRSSLPPIFNGTLKQK